MSVVTLNNVRLTFPALFEPEDFQGDGKAKFKASFLFPPEHPAHDLVKKAMQTAAKGKWGAKAADVYKGLKAGDKLCLHDGDAKVEYEGFPGNLYVSASNNIRPLVIDGNKSPLTATDGKPYSGCYVNARVELYAQDNKWGKRINASLLGVQFLRDGERLSGGTVATEDDFDAIPDADGGGFDEAETAESGDSVFD